MRSSCGDDVVAEGAALGLAVPGGGASVGVGCAAAGVAAAAGALPGFFTSSRHLLSMSNDSKAWASTDSSPPE